MNSRKLNTCLISLLLLMTAQTLPAAERDQVTRLKTLFTTPLERKKLDQLRNAGKFDKKTAQGSGLAVTRQPLTVEVKGIVFREKGRPVVWVNDGNTLKSQKIEDGVKVRTSFIKKRSLKVPVKVFQQTLSMKPGQQWTETERKIKDKYQIKRPETETGEASHSQISMDNEGSVE